MPFKKHYIISLLALTLLLNSSYTSIPAFSQAQYVEQNDYTQYYNAGINYYNSSNYTKAIEEFKTALKIAPRKATVRNNIAASHIARGNYYQSNKQYKNAAKDYLYAIYYLAYDAPEDAKLSDNTEENLTVARTNLNNAYQGLNVNPNDASFHFNAAKEYRAQGEFRPAIVESYIGLEKSPQTAGVYEDIGEMYNVIQNYEHATKAFEKAIEINPDSASAQAKLGFARLKNNNVDEAIDAFNTVSALDPKNMDVLNALEKIWVTEIRNDPKNVAAHTNLAIVFQKKGLYDRALAEYRTAEQLDPNNRTIRLNLGTLLQAKGDYKMAIRAYDTILQVDPKNTLARYYKATALKEAKDYQKAVEELNTILQIEPSNQYAKDELAKIAKDFGGSLGGDNSIYKQLADSDPNSAKAQYDAGFEAHTKGNLDTAIAYYRKSISIDPKMKDAYANLGAALKAKKDYEEALTVLNKAAELDPTNNDVQRLKNDVQQILGSSKYEQAIDLHRQGKLEEAISVYKQLLEDSPNDAELLTNIGAAYQSMKDYDEAISYYKRSLAIDPKSAMTHYYLATTYRSKNMIKEALASLNNALQLEPNNTQLQESVQSMKEDYLQQLLSGVLDLYNEKQYDKAVQKVNDAIKIDPQYAPTYYYQGLVLEAKNDNYGAVGSYRKAIQYDPDMESAYYQLAVILDKINDTNGAKEAFRKFLEISGGKQNTFTDYAKERLKQL